MIEQNDTVIRRGPGSKFYFYSDVVHQDYCFGPEKFYDNILEKKTLEEAELW